MSKISDLLADVRKDMGLTEEKGVVFDSPEQANAAIDGFLRDFSEVASTSGSVVRVRETERKVNDKGWELTFDVVFDLENDSFVAGEKYKKGEAHIYLSDGFYKKLDELGNKYFGGKPGWNNTATIGWFIGAMGKEK